MSKLRVAVVGYGNVGRYVLRAVQGAPDMELAGLVRRRRSETVPPELTGIPVVDKIEGLAGVQGAVLCVPTRSVAEYARQILARGIHTSDSFDIHGDAIFELRRELAAIARESGSAAHHAGDSGRGLSARRSGSVGTPPGLNVTPQTADPVPPEQGGTFVWAAAGKAPGSVEVSRGR